MKKFACDWQLGKLMEHAGGYEDVVWWLNTADG
jgi:hypothetical protein